MKKYHVLLIAAMATLGLSACDNGDSPADNTAPVEDASMMDNIEEKGEEASEEAMETIEEAVDEASESMDEMMEEMSNSAEKDLSESMEKMMDN
jgi:vacuolar-type H+-ATPase catalytic subunit A/Vma1